ncbi:putative protein phosphatase 2C 66 [Platanthera guangdongensis]|uniref:Uncharacterized protein n=1 Tax=Platanthera guangdongensis TaxID=2320717 RepID=A0ABR2LPZ6_9ASPA
MGKSSTVNSILGEWIAYIFAFQVCQPNYSLHSGLPLCVCWGGFHGRRSSSGRHFLIQEVCRIKKGYPENASAIVNDRVKGYLKVERVFGAGWGDRQRGQGR